MKNNKKKSGVRDTWIPNTWSGAWVARNKKKDANTRKEKNGEPKRIKGY